MSAFHFIHPEQAEKLPISNKPLALMPLDTGVQEAVSSPALVCAMLQLGEHVCEHCTSAESNG